MKKKWRRNFSEWNAPAVRECFGLVRQQESPVFLDWLGARFEQPAAYAPLIEHLRGELFNLVNNWNEIELLARFIAPVLATIGFDGPGYSQFHGRTLAFDLARVGKVSGSVDGLVAKGEAEPEIPMFFLHEYKKSQGYDADPEGQLLIAMIAAQRLNADGQPLYGCYVVGSYWRFVLLEGQTYSVSQGYDATDAGELRIIWSVLVHTKQLIEERVKLILDSEL